MHLLQSLRLALVHRAQRFLVQLNKNKRHSLRCLYA
jgi:hypothetical protein